MSDERHDEREMRGASEATQRQAALRALAQEQTSADATPSPRASASAPLAWRLASPRRRGATWRLIVSALSVLAVVAVIGVVVANIVIGQRPAAPAAKTALRLNLLRDGLSCAMNIAWSPDGKQVAVLGNTVNCGGSALDSQTGAVFIYAVPSGRLVQQLHPDKQVFDAPAIGKLIGTNLAASSPPTALSYTTLLWTPDSQALLMPFFVELQMPSGQSPSVNGLLRLGVSDSSLTRVWIGSNAYIQVGTVERWDLTSGAPQQIPAPPAATAYRWNSDGTVSPIIEAGSQPVGTPDGGKTFTIWQPGQLGYSSFQSGPDAKPTVSPQDVSWGVNITPISPDGRYFYTYFPASGSLVPPSTQIVMPHDTTIAPRDKALLALAQTMTQKTVSVNQYAQTFVAWRPDGHLLAELPANSKAPVSASAFTVSLYDTATGKLVKRLTPDISGLQTGPAGIEALMWSPDGSHLLLMDNVYGAITIWGPGALPA